MLVSQKKEMMVMDMEGSGYSERSKKFVVAESGWRIGDRERIGSIGDAKVGNGDLIMRDGELVLVCSNLQKIKGLRRLFSFSNFTKVICNVHCIKGSNTHGHSILGEKADGEVYFLKSGDIKSQLFVKAAKLASPFSEDRPDLLVLESLGIILPKKNKERQIEKERRNKIQKQYQDLDKERSSLQVSIVNANYLQSKKIYARIKQIEDRLLNLRAELTKYRNWSSPDWDDLNQFIDLVDINNWQHKVLKDIVLYPKKATVGSNYPEIFFLQFEDGSFSDPISILPKRWTEFPLSSLKEAGFISEDAIEEAEDVFQTVKEEIADKEKLRKRLGELKSKREEFGLGRRTTQRTMAEKAEIEEKLQKEAV